MTGPAKRRSGGPRATEPAAAAQPLEAWQRVGALSAVPRLLAARGVDPAEVLAAAGLRADALDDPEGRIPYATTTTLLARCAYVARCPHFGLLAGAEWHLSDLGLAGQLARCSATLGEALRTMAVYLRLNNQGAATFMRQAGRSVELGYAVFHPGLTELAVTYDLVMASAVNQLRELLGNASWRPTAVLLPRSAPAEARPYRARFGCPIEFNADRAALRFPATELSRGLPEADPSRRANLLREAQARFEEPFQVRVYATLRTLLLEGVARSDFVAGNLSMHKRTLARRLAEHGTTFQNVLDEVRFEVARQLLRETTLGTGDIAAALGYAEASAFTRSFRRWAGVPPTAWRDRPLT